VTDAWQSLAIGEFEHVAAGPSVVLLRVNGRSSRPRPSPDWRPTLIADHGSGPERFEALPSPPDAEGVLRAAYSVPAALITPEARFRLELQDGETVDLGTPAAGTPRRTGEHRERPAETSEQSATLSAALAEARDRAAQLQGENDTLSATLEELEIWRGELERRLADTTTELAEARARLAEAHAAAEMEALVARAEADALEQAARELVQAAESARSAD
jgi:HAMP domain-containing protein